MSTPRVPKLVPLGVALAVATAALCYVRLVQRPRALVGASSDAARALAELRAPTATAAVALLDPGGTAHRELELLATYGFPRTPRVTGVAGAPARGRWVVANAELDDALRAALRASVEDGAWVVELGPRPAVCGPRSSHEPSSETIQHRVQGAGLDRVRWPVALATLPDCHARECGDAVVLASAAPIDAPDRSVPLVTRQRLGKGACTRWLGDLGQAIQRLRQGDPQRVAARGRAGAPFKPGDLFAGDLQEADYELPSADRLGFALAAQIVAAPGPDVLVSPLPAASAGLVVFTADQDFVPGAGVLAQSAALGGAGFTVTLTAADIGGKPDVIFRQGEGSLMAPELVAELAERGQDVGIHPNLNDLPAARYREVLERHVAAFRQRYGTAPRVVRTHHLIWRGYVEMARLQADAGLSLDLDFVTAPDGTGYHPGFMTGSGLPMRFVDERGHVLAIYQQATQIDDYVFTPAQAASREQALALLITGTRRLLAVSRREHVPLTLLHHPAWWFETEGAWQKQLLHEAARHGMPVWGAGRFLSFVEDARATLVSADRSGFEVVSAAPHVALLVEGAQRWSIDGEEVATAQTRTLAGTTYRELTLPGGRVRVEGH